VARRLPVATDHSDGVARLSESQIAAQADGLHRARLHARAIPRREATS
jgi:hypothetical protein